MNFGAFAVGLAVAFALLLFGRLPLLRRAAGDTVSSFTGSAGAGAGAGATGPIAPSCVKICDSCTPSSTVPPSPLAAPFSAPCALIGAPFAARVAQGTCGPQFFSRTQ